MKSRDERADMDQRESFEGCAPSSLLQNTAMLSRVAKSWHIVGTLSILFTKQSIGQESRRRRHLKSPQRIVWSFHHLLGLSYLCLLCHLVLISINLIIFNSELYILLNCLSKHYKSETTNTKIKSNQSKVYLVRQPVPGDQ